MSRFKGIIALTKAQYDALATKDPDTLYLTTDKNIPIPTVSDEGKGILVNSSGEYALGHDTSKQDTLTAGENITIANNVISASGGLPVLTGTTNPTSSTVGQVGQLYTNTTSGVYKSGWYICTNVSDSTHTWERLFVNKSIIDGNELNLATGNGYCDGRKAVAIGYDAIAKYGGSCAVGGGARALGFGSICIGENAISAGYHDAKYSIQLGTGTVTTANTMQVWNHQLLNKDTGKIPADRLSTITTSTASSVTLANAAIHVITNLPSALTVNLPTPTSGTDFLTGVIFRAGTDFALTETAPNNYMVYYEDAPTWTDGKLYEIIYRCLWLLVSTGETDVTAGTVKVDSLTFQTANSAVGDYTYTYDGTDWKDSTSTTVTLATLGITLTGTPASGDTITVSNLYCISVKCSEVTA